MCVPMCVSPVFRLEVKFFPTVLKVVHDLPDNLILSAIFFRMHRSGLVLYRAKYYNWYDWCPSELIAHTCNPGNDFQVPPPREFSPLPFGPGRKHRGDR